jgi:MFS family permease
LALAERPSVWQLLSSLAASFVFCTLFALGGVLGAETLGGWIAWMVGWGAYWLVFAMLQAHWWHKGYSYFWRPVYAYTLLGFMAILVLPLLFLLVPAVRRWLSRKTKPYDPPDSKGSLSAGKELDEAGWFLERGELGQALKRIHLARKRALRTENTQLLVDTLSMAEALQPKTQGRMRSDADRLIEALKTHLG